MKLKAIGLGIMLMLPLVHFRAQDRLVSKEQKRKGTIGLQANLVELDVVVTDVHDKPITNLKPSEVEVYEDGVQQKFVVFEQISKGYRTAPSDQDDLNVTKGKDNALSKPSPPRYSLIFISVGPDERAFLAARKKKLFEAIHGLAGPSDRVAVATPEGIMQDFTNDSALVCQAVEAVLSHEPVTSRITRVLTAPSSSAAIGQVSLGSLIARQVFSPNEHLADARGYREFIKRVFLQDFVKVIRSLSLLPGRKQVIWFNSGLMLKVVGGQRASVSPSPNHKPLSVGADIPLFERLIDVANRGGISFYVIDARGLMAPEISRMTQGSAILGYLAAITGSQYAPRILARATGGRFYGLNRSEEGIRWAAQDAHNYYHLAYYPSNIAQNGRFRRITVKVKRRGIRVRTRVGYWAPKPFARMTVAERRDQMVEALLSEKTYRTLPVIAEGYIFPQAKKDGVLISVVIEVDGATIPVRWQEGRYQGSVDILAQILTLSGQPKKLIDRTIRLNLRPSRYEELRRRYLRYVTQVELLPGEYRLRVVVRENEEGRLGSAEKKLVVPMPDPERLLLSDVVLCIGEEGRESLTSLPAVGSLRLIPSGARMFQQSSPAIMSLQVKRAAKATGSPVDLELSYRVMRGREVIYQGREFLAQPRMTNSIVSIVRRLPVERMAPGHYELEVIVKDRITGESQLRRTDFHVQSAPMKIGVWRKLPTCAPSCSSFVVSSEPMSDSFEIGVGIVPLPSLWKKRICFDAGGWV